MTARTAMTKALDVLRAIRALDADEGIDDPDVRDAVLELEQALREAGGPARPPAGATIAGWRRFRAIYAPIMAPEWMTWTAANKQAMDQAKFSQFIEDNLPDVAQPPGADLLTITRSIEAKKKVNFASSIRLSDGSHQLTFEEEVQGSAAKGQLTIPESIRLAIPVLLNGPRYAVDARLRYRIDQAGKLALWVDLLRPHEIVQHAVTEARKTIADGTGLQVLVGFPD